jgi:hypothetical protein
MVSGRSCADYGEQPIERSQLVAAWQAIDPILFIKKLYKSSAPLIFGSAFQADMYLNRKIAAIT